jgi:ribose 5-phosphate isomerase B
MKIAVTTDHAGYEALGLLKNYIESLGHEVVSFGPVGLDPEDDYPDFMFPAAKAVASGEYEMAVILGGSGQGEAMAANRIKGVRCAVFYGPILPQHPVDAEGNVSSDPYEIVKLSRQHNNSNVLSLGSRFLSFDEMKHAIETWLNTPFSEMERHARRNQKLDDF